MTFEMYHDANKTSNFGPGWCTTKSTIILYQKF